MEEKKREIEKEEVKESKKSKKKYNGISLRKKNGL